MFHSLLMLTFFAVMTIAGANGHYYAAEDKTRV